MPEHTPGPIHVEHEVNLIASDGYSLTGAPSDDHCEWNPTRNVANAIHAVTCWNSHDALVAALKRLVSASNEATNRELSQRELVELCCAIFHARAMIARTENTNA
jgi:hypothetical protein